MDKEELKDPTLFEIMKENPDITYNEATKILKLKKEAGACITAGMKRDKDAVDKMKNRDKKIAELNIRVAELLEIDEAHQKQMGKLQTRLTEVEEDNKKLSHQIEDIKMNGVRKAGL